MQTTITSQPKDVVYTQITGVAQRLARGAHNSEVTRSKRVAGIYHHIAPVHQALEQHFKPP